LSYSRVFESVDCSTGHFAQGRREASVGRCRGRGSEWPVATAREVHSIEMSPHPALVRRPEAVQLPPLGLARRPELLIAVPGVVGAAVDPQLRRFIGWRPRGLLGLRTHENNYRRFGGEP